MQGVYAQDVVFFLFQVSLLFSNIRNTLQAMAAVRSRSLCVSSINLVSIRLLAVLTTAHQLGSFFCRQLLAHNLWTPAGREAGALPASAPGYSRHTVHAIQLRQLQPSCLSPWRGLTQGRPSHVLEKREAGRCSQN